MLLRPDTAAPASFDPQTPLAASYVAWQAMARMEAARIAPALQAGGPWRIAPANENWRSSFLDVFPQMLASELSARGVALTSAPGAGELRIDMRVNDYDGKRYRTGTLSLVAVGLWVVSFMNPTAAGLATMGMVGADVRESEKQLNKDGGVEVALTLQAEQGGLIAASTTGVYLTLGRENFTVKASEPDVPVAAAQAARVLPLSR